jgi:hypothetical protein
MNQCFLKKKNAIKTDFEKPLKNRVNKFCCFFGTEGNGVDKSTGSLHLDV